MKDKVLDKFLFECKKSKIQKRIGIATHINQTKDISPYANPDNWTAQRIVGLYQGTIHASTFLGNYVELRFKDSRRLVTFAGRLGQFSEPERSVQSELLARLPRSTEILPEFGREAVSRADTESEVLALTQRFNELMGEFSLNHSGVL